MRTQPNRWSARGRRVAAVAAALGASVVLSWAAATAGRAATPAYLDTSLPFAERAADLVARMTLEEKAAQLSTTNAPAIPRLGVQEYAYWSEAQHGVMAFLGGDYSTGRRGNFTTPVAATSFPTNLATSMTWDPSLVRRETDAISDEARGFLDPRLFGRSANNLGPSAGDYGSLFYFNPTINIARDPRWGRTDETFGEDPFLTGAMGSAYVDGFQGQTSKHRLRGRYLKAVATAKHLALNNVESYGALTSANSDSRADEATIRDYYVPHFRRVVEDARAGGLMSSYNAVNGTPAVANPFLLNVLARRTWGFDGYVTSDCGALAASYRNGTPPSDYPPGLRYPGGHDWAPPGWSTNHAGDRAEWTRSSDGAKLSAPAGAEAFSLRAGTDLNCGGRESGVDRLREAIRAGVLGEGVVDRALVRVFTLRMRTGEFDPPREQPYKRITSAVIQSPAHRALTQEVARQAIVLLQNRRPAGGTAPLLPADPSRLHRVVILGDQADRAFLGGYSGAPGERVSLRAGLTAALAAANPGAAVTYDAAGTSSTATGPASLSSETRQAIRDADLVVVMVGTDAHTGREGLDRASIEMPGNYRSLVDQVAAVGNPRIALVVQASGPVALGAARDKVAAILFSAPNGQRQGSAAADVLLGRTNPSGHLSFTWYGDDSQLPPMGDYGISPRVTAGLGRSYEFFTRRPEFDFGFGVSYTSFRWSRARLDRRTVGAGGAVRASVTVTNSGSRPGATVVQLYAVSPRIAGRAVPRRRLVGFEKTRVLAPGESQRVRIEVRVPDTLRLWDPRARRSVVAPGAWRLEPSRAAGDPVKGIPIRVTGRLSSKIRHVTLDPPASTLHVGERLDLRGVNPWLRGLPSRGAPAAAARIVTAVRWDDSFANLGRVRIRFRSDRPRVLRMSRRGALTALRPGTATVTVRIGGASARTSFAIR